jgi:hypothetical protein
MEAAAFGGLCAVLASTATALVMGALVARRMKQRYQSGFADGRLAGNEEAGRFRADKYRDPEHVPAYWERRN